MRSLVGLLLAACVVGCEAVPRVWQTADAQPISDTPRPIDATTPDDTPQRVEVISLEDAPDAGTSLTQASCLPTAVAGCGLTEIEGATTTLGLSSLNVASPEQPGITVSAFLMDTHEVSIARFRRYVLAGRPSQARFSIVYPGGVPLAFVPSSLPADPSSAMANHVTLSDCLWTDLPSNREAMPVNCVSWSTAQAFCVWDGGRLPTEAEWELAAVGVERRRYPWGSNADRTRSAYGGLRAVDETTFATGRTPEGIWHMHGNVAELTADAFSPYSDRPCWGGEARRDPLCLVQNNRVVVRGGFANGGFYESTTRTGRTPDALWDLVGFRCARSRPRSP